MDYNFSIEADLSQLGSSEAELFSEHFEGLKLFLSMAQKIDGASVTELAV
jgi:hypothetical protein